MPPAGFLAAANGPINIAGLTQLVGSMIGLLVLVAGAGILLKVHGQRNIAAAAGSLAIMLVGLAVAGLSLTGKVDAVATSLANLIFA